MGRYVTLKEGLESSQFECAQVQGVELLSIDVVRAAGLRLFGGLGFNVRTCLMNGSRVVP